MSRKVLGAILTVLLIMLAFTLPAAAAPTVIVDGVTLSFSVPSRVDRGTTLVPLRGIFEALGASVVWDGATQTVNASKSDTQIQLKIGSTTAYCNGQPVTLSVPGKVIEGSTLVPLRFVSEALGATVNWQGATETISIVSASPTTPQEEVATPPGVPPDLGKALTREFGSVGGLTDYGFTHVITDSTIMASVRMKDYEANQKWRALPESTRKKFLGDMLNRVRSWYPDRGIFVSVSITYSYHTWNPSLNDNIVSFDLNRGWYVSNTHYSGHATYFWDGAVTIDPNE